MITINKNGKRNFNQSMLDTTREVEVPEGITLSLPVASLVSRSLAFILDQIISWAIIFTAVSIFNYLGNFGRGLTLITLFLVQWFYPVFFEIFYNGQTLGKKVLGLVVINDDGTPIDWSSSIVRNLLRVADFLPFGYAGGLVCMLFSRDFKRLGDYAAGTLVVHKSDQIDDLEVLNVEARAPKISLTLDEQRAILNFAERMPKMSEDRVNELAQVLLPWLDQDKVAKNREPAAMQLSKIAKWLRGH